MKYHLHSLHLRHSIARSAPFGMALRPCRFALAYADQAERDHAALKAAVRAGIVEVQLEH